MKECDQIPEIPSWACSHASPAMARVLPESRPRASQRPRWDSCPVGPREGGRLLRGIFRSADSLNQNHLVGGRGASVLVKMLIGTLLSTY